MCMSFKFFYSFILFILGSDLPNWRPWSSTSVVADLLVSNGTIYTSDSQLPFADSMAVLNGRILRIGDYSFVQVIYTHSLIFNFKLKNDIVHTPSVPKYERNFEFL